MIENYLLIFTAVVIINWLVFRFFGKNFALDKPNSRKQHSKIKPQIGGLIFGAIFIFISIIYDLAPNWFLIGGASIIILGLIDDNFKIPWKVKLILQIVILFHALYYSWSVFDFINFYNYQILNNKPVLIFIFSLWFVGILNAVNLIDGLDGLAGGIMLIFCLSSSFLYGPQLFLINLIFVILLIAFLLFNQRPAKFFMGDTGSLFLGYYVAVNPLLISHFANASLSMINITSLIILTSFLIADTSRVFFTRIMSGKSPMNPDTIHFHHLVLQNSGSYLLTLLIIFTIVSISGMFSILNALDKYDSYFMLFHVSLIFLFILTPPAPTYVKLISKAFKSLESFRSKSKFDSTLRLKTILIGILTLLLFFSVVLNHTEIFYHDYLISAFSLSLIFIYFNRKNKIIIPFIQLFLFLLILKNGLFINYNVLTYIFALMIIISLIVFTLQKVKETELYNYSTLDLIIFLFTFHGSLISIFNYDFNAWFFIINFSLWIGVGFILKRIFNQLKS